MELKLFYIKPEFEDGSRITIAVIATNPVEAYAAARSRLEHDSSFPKDKVRLTLVEEPTIKALIFANKEGKGD